MAEEKSTRRLHQARIALGFVLGSVGTLFVTAVAGDLQYTPGGLPFGWFFVWLMTTLGSIPLGIVMLTGAQWRTVPLAQRRGPAMGYLFAGFVNVLGFALQLAAQSAGPVVWLPVALYALALFVIYARLYASGETTKEELFP